MVPASINADPNTISISQEIDNEEQLWVVEPVLEYPEWDYECFHCGKEMEEHEGYLRDGECYCDSCAYDLFDQPMPKSKYTDEMWENFHKKQELEQQELVFECYDCGVIIGEKEGCFSDGQRICDMCNYELTVSERPSTYYFDENNEKFDKMAEANIEADTVARLEEDVWEELAKIVLHDKEFEQTPVKSIIPDDAIVIDDDYVYCNTYDEAKEMLKRASFNKNEVVQDLPHAYIVSQNNSKFWFKLSKDIKEPTKFIIYVYASKDEVAKKYIRRMLEECMYRIDYLISPEDYQSESDDCATEEDMANFYREQEADIARLEQNDMEQNDIDVVNMGSNYETYYTNKALCVTCGEINYAEPVCEVEGHSRMVCCDCIEIVNHCEECNNLTLDYVYDSTNDNGVNRDLCFDCKFKTKEREQMPLAVHLLLRSNIQFLSDKQFYILTDYAELAQLTIFDAYRYKSRCHFYDCDRMVAPSEWNAEQSLQFCCKRHNEMSQLIGCHCQNVNDGTDYDGEYEEATCKMCYNSNYETNMIPRIALKNSDLGVKPIVSAICVFNEGIKMSNVLAESLVDLCEYFI